MFSSVAVDVTATSSLILGDVRVLLVSVSTETRDNSVELAPAGNIKVFVTPAECGCPNTFCPWLLLSQLKTIAAELVLPLTTTVPVPCGAKSRSALETVITSPPIDKSPAIVMLRKLEASLFASTVTVLLATTVPTAAPVSL